MKVYNIYVKGGTEDDGYLGSAKGRNAQDAIDNFREMDPTEGRALEAEEMPSQ